MNDRIPRYWEASSVALQTVEVTLTHTVNTEVDSGVMVRTMNGTSTDSKTVIRIPFAPGEVPAVDEVMFAITTLRPASADRLSDNPSVPMLALPDFTALPIFNSEGVRGFGFPDIEIPVALTLAITGPVWNPDTEEYETGSGTIIVHLLVTIGMSTTPGHAGNEFQWELKNVVNTSTDNSGNPDDIAIVVTPTANNTATPDDAKEVNLRTWKNRDGNTLDIGGSLLLDRLPPDGYDIINWQFDCAVEIVIA